MSLCHDDYDLLLKKLQYYLLLMFLNKVEDPFVPVKVKLQHFLYYNIIFFGGVQQKGSVTFHHSIYTNYEEPCMTFSVKIIFMCIFLTFLHEYTLESIVK